MPARAGLGIAFALVVAACSSDAASGSAIDGGADATIDAAPSNGDDANDEDSGFGPGQPSPFAFEDCDGGCATGEYCFAEHFVGGGARRALDDLADGGAPGCHVLPTPCADAATCACVLAETDAAACEGYTRDCVVEDAGEILERCWIARP